MRIFIFLLFLSQIAMGQSDILDQYIQEALQNNLALKQKYSAYQKSLYEKKEAHGLFYPNISFNARYTVAEGGRIIDIFG
jgi:outer membrane protein TolC